MRSWNRNLRLAASVLPLLTIILIGIWGCGDAPPAPVDQVGSIAVTGMLPDTTLADFIDIIIDFDTLGVFPNPHTITNVFAGVHRLEVTTRDTITPDDIEVYKKIDFVTVEPEEVTTTALMLTQEGPYQGNPAPDFALYDLDSNLVSLSDLEGKVVLLYFFSNT